MIIGEFDLIQFFPGRFQISQNIRTADTVLAAQFMYDIQAGLNLIQFSCRIRQRIPGIPQFFRCILHLIHKIRNLFVQLRIGICEPAEPGQFPLGFCQQGCGAIGIITAV